MRKCIPLTTLVLMLLIVSVGCVKTHINDVSDENQEIELFILRAGQSLQKMETARDSALETAVGLYNAGTLSADSLKTIVQISKSYDTAFKVAQSALLELRQAVDRGDSVETATVEAALAAVSSILKELQGGL